MAKNLQKKKPLPDFCCCLFVLDGWLLQGEGLLITLLCITGVASVLGSKEMEMFSA